MTVGVTALADASGREAILARPATDPVRAVRG